ncbi:MAG TPA: hypothetical protein VMT58_00760, partial [Candidatus Binataceae bacterium]|nr:hypothetical protein [Candidatus Binataceae bacterium]
MRRKRHSTSKERRSEPAKIGGLWRLGDESRSNAALAAILIGGALIFANSLRNGFVFDDDNMIVNNGYLDDWSFVWKSFVNDSWWFSDPHRLPASSYYRPIQDLWLWLNFHIFGFDAAGWHAATIALHLVVVWLVFRVGSALIAGCPEPIDDEA